MWMRRGGGPTATSAGSGRWWRTSLCFMWGPPRAAPKCWYRCWARFSAAFFAAIVGWFIGRTIPGGCSYAGLTGRGTFWGLPIMRAAPRRSNFAETHWRLWLGWRAGERRGGEGGGGGGGGG